MQTDERYQELVAQLLEKSQAREVNWQVTANPNEFIVYFENFSLAIVAQKGDRGKARVVVRVLDEEGQELYAFSYDEYEEAGTKAIELFTLARNKAARIDESLDAIFSELDTKDVVGRTAAKDPALGDDDIPF